MAPFTSGCVNQVGRPAVAAKLLAPGQDTITVLVDILKQASPAELVATAGFARRPNGDRSP